MRWGLSWGAQAPHHIIVAGRRYEVRTTKLAGVWTAYATVAGVCVEATGNCEREARQKWQQKVEAMSPLLEVEQRVEDALDEAAAALDDAAATIAAQSAGEQTVTSDSPAAPASERPILPPETCEIPRSVNRRLRPPMRRER